MSEPEICPDCGKPRDGGIDSCAADRRNAEHYGWVDDCRKATIARLRAELSSVQVQLDSAHAELGVYGSNQDEPEPKGIEELPAGTKEAMQDAALRRDIFDCVRLSSVKVRHASWYYLEALRRITAYRAAVTESALSTVKALSEAERRLVEAAVEYAGSLDSGTELDRAIDSLVALRKEPDGNR